MFQVSESMWTKKASVARMLGQQVCEFMNLVTAGLAPRSTSMQAGSTRLSRSAALYMSCWLVIVRLSFLGDVLPWPATRQKWENKQPPHTQAPGWAGFKDWFDTLDQVDEISRAIKNRSKLRARLTRVINTVERFKDMKVVMPIQGSAVKMWTRTLVSLRYLQLHDPILFMLKGENHKVIKTMVGLESRPRFEEYVVLMQGGLDRRCTEVLTFLMPLYKWQKFADANHPGCFQCGYQQWGIMKQQTLQAIGPVHTIAMATHRQQHSAQPHCTWGESFHVCKRIFS